MAYTIDKVGGTTDAKHTEILGSSTDVKPTTAENPRLRQNDLFVELDTGDAYYWDEVTQSWIIVGG